MKRYTKYLFVVVLLIISVSSFSVIDGNIRADKLQYEVSQPNDTVPRYPVKKTQIETYKDLKKNPPADLKDPSNITTKVEYDSETGFYIFRTKVGNDEVATPFSLSADEYNDYTLRKSMHNYFRNKNIEAYEKRDEKEDFSLKDIKLNIGAAEKLFGPGGVKVRTQGYIEATMGFKRNSTDNPTLSERSRSRTTFEFKEDIQMNVTASVGDKINFGMNYDTKALFDFDSKSLKLGYEGKEDEIIKKIEAGNVSMSTTNSLINGGSALFGINAELQFGKLRVNAVVSQQESQSQTVNSKGGVQTKDYEFKVDQYDENRHFFLNHYFRDNYDNAMSKLPYIQSPVNITRIEVWVTNKRSENQSRNIVAFADLGEHKVIKNPDNRWSPSGSIDAPYNDANTLYKTITGSYPTARDLKEVTALFSGYIENSLDYEKVESARLLSTSEYSYNSQLGYISLTSALQTDEVLAVAYEYTMSGKTYQVGEFSADISDKYDSANPKSGALFVRLLKPTSLSPRAYTWDLMMKNVYYLGAMGIQKDRFRLNISYQSDTIGTYINYLPEGDIKKELLIRVMNLDNLNSNNNQVSDNKGNKGDGIFDFVEGYTIKSQTGRVYFPVVEPFGKHLAKMIGNSTIADKYVYQQLYDSTLTIARQIAEKNKFKIYGSYRGSSSSDAEIDLGATNIPQGSVKISSNGVQLTEGADYIVDYMSGVATIINQNLLDSNSDIQVNLEERSLGMQRKTLLGLNLSYDISKDFTIGGTIMHMYEKPLTTKTLVGDESVKNTLWGLNTSFKTESMWLTNLVDKLPFYNATQPSHISFSAEFAQMIAGHYQNDDAGGYSYLDDFESSESRIDIKSPYAWSLASIPNDKDNEFFPPLGIKYDIENGKNRAMLSWFMIDPLFTRRGSSLTPSHIKNDTEQLSNHFVREVNIWELYPNKDLNYTESATLPVLNLSYYPNERGPYNLDATNIDQEGKLKDPEKRWAGITRKMDVRDFESSNIEYIEFWLMDPFVNNDKPEYYTEGGDLYFNLGEISEDVLKDGQKFYENGLPVDDDPTAYEYTVWGKVPTRRSTVYAFDDNMGDLARQKQDVGLNGLSTAEEFEFQTYKDYLTEYRSRLSTTAIEALQNNPLSPLNDPAGDTYHFFRGSDYDQQQTSILDRYKYYNNTEGNSVPTDQTNESYSTAARNVPDVEDIDQDNTLNETEGYFQYKISLAQDKMNVGENYIVDRQVRLVELRNGTKENITWYQFKIPIRQYDKRVGNIQDFKSIRFMRMFLTKFKQPTFLRFGTLQLVRGDWRVYEQALGTDNTSGNGTLDVSTVNIEENADRTPVNYVLPPGINRSIDPQQAQITKDNEQSLSLKVIDLDPGDARAVYRNTSYDLRRYKRIQLFTHAEELINSNDNLRDGELTVFMRLGSDYKNNYYEYEIPLTVTPEGSYSSNNSNDRYTVWPKDNMFDFPLELLKDVKLERNREKRKAGSSVSYTTPYFIYDPEKTSNKVTVMGNPSLSDVYVIMIGVRNNTRVNRSGEVWINELRLTDFDDEGGWAAQGNLNVALSDLATINLSGRKETSGFGALDQSLMERRNSDYHTYSISTSIELGKLLPEKAKVSLPLYYSYSNQTTTPKYDPFDQDVTLKESLSLVETKAEKDSIKSLAQDKVTTKSISLNNVKVNIQSKTPMPYDPANFTFGYAYSQSETKNPSTVYDLVKNYNLTFGYSYSPLMKTWEPFKNVKSQSGAAKFAKSIGFNYLPSIIEFNSKITRYYTETVLRDIESYRVGGENDSEFLSWSQSFLWDRDFNINWDFTKNLKFSFQSGTRAEIEEPYLQVNKKLNRDDYEIWKDSVMHSIKNLGTPLSYRQKARLTYDLPFKNIPAMNWISMANVSYTSGYQWDRGAQVEGVEIGNTISNDITMDFKTRFNLTSLYNKSGFLKKVNERFDSQRRQSPTQRQQQARQQPERRRYTQTVTLRKDTTITVTHNLKTKNIEVLARKDGKSYPIKFKKTNENAIQITNKDSVNIQLVVESKVKDSNTPQILVDIAEYSARGLMSLRSVEFNYSKRKETHISGFRPGIGDMFGQKDSEYGLVPGLAFAFGLEGGEDFIDKSMSRDWLVISEDNITPAVYNESEKFEMKAIIEPFKDFKIDLKASRENNKRTEIQYMFDGMPRTLGGSFSMTTVALSTALRSSNPKNNYQSDAFDKFLEYRDVIRERLESKYQRTKYPHGGFLEGTQYSILMGEDYSPSNGSVDPNSADVLIPAFIAAYTGRDINKISLTAFPSLSSILPNWGITYTGLQRLPFFKDKFKHLQLNHGYTCFYQVGGYGSHSNWMQAEDDLGYIRDVLSGSPNPSSPYDISSVGITEKFNPLFGVDATMNNNMSVEVRYNNARTLTLNMSAYQIIEYLEREFVLGLGYRINEFNRVIGLTSRTPKNFNNDLNIRVDISHKTTESLLRKLEESFTQATNGVTIFTLKFSADYTLSRSLTLKAYYDRILNKPLISSTSYPTTNSNFGLSLKFTLVQ